MISVVMMPSWNKPHPALPSILFSSAWINRDRDTVPDDHCEFDLTVFWAMHSSFPHIPPLTLQVWSGLTYRGDVMSLTGLRLGGAAPPVGAVVTSFTSVDFWSAIGVGSEDQCG
jgi:hypothetical protein